MFGMLGGAENMSESLNGCSFTLGKSLHKRMEVGGGRQNVSQSEAGGFQSVCQPMLQHADCSTSCNINGMTSTVLIDGKSFVNFE